jgi:hypothetical protein
LSFLLSKQHFPVYLHHQFYVRQHVSVSYFCLCGVGSEGPQDTLNITADLGR